MAKKKVFISYDYDHDKHYKNLLLAWDKNKQFDFYLYDQSVDVSVDSTDAAAIKRVISARINASTYFLCIVGKHTHKSAWVAWEIDKAVGLGKKIVAVKTDRSNTTPAGLYGVGASWAMSFTFVSIKNAIENA
ncbi:MAG: TIR domain-containing protein [Acetomicrobium sp.]|nr:TIR domain-containing protein [Acetomicrobium sp.]